MRKWMIAGVVVVLLCVGLFVALLNINSYIARNKTVLLDRAEQALGRKVSVEDIKLTLSHGLGLRLTNFAMADDPAFSSNEFVRAKDLQLNVKLLPLLRKDLQIKRIILHDPVINIIRNKRGIYNFSTIAQTAEKEKKGAKKNQQAASEQNQASSALLVSVANISNGQVRYRDDKEGTNLQLQRIDMEVEDFDFNKPFTVELAAALYASKQNLKMNTTVGPFSSGADFRDLPLDGTINVDPLDMSRLETAVPKLKTALPKHLELAGIFKVHDLKFAGTLKNLAIKGTLVGNDGAVRYANLFQKARGIPLQISTDARYGANRVVLRQAQIRLYNLKLASKGEITLGEHPVLNLSVASNPASLDGWEKIVPAIATYQLSGKMQIHGTVRGPVGKGALPRIQGTATLENASARPPQFSKPLENLNATVAFTGERADIKATTFNLGSSKIHLAATVEKFSPFSLTYKVSTPELIPAEFQTALSEERKTDRVRNLSSEGQVSIQKGNLTINAKLVSTDGTLSKIGYRDLQTTFSMANKVAEIRDLRVNTLKGVVQANGEYAFNGAVPHFALDSKVQGLDLKEIYDTFGPQGQDESQRDVRGQLNANMKIAGSGKKWDEMKPTLRGQGQAQVLQGALLNFNIADSILGSTGIPGLSNIISPSIRKKYPETFEAKDTRFKEMKADFTVANARANIKNLLITAADFTVKGDGWVDFDRKVDFDSVLLVSRPLSADLAHSASEMKFLFNNQGQLSIPFTLKGTLPHVKPKPDAGYLAKSLQRGFLQKAPDQLQQFLGNKDSSDTRDEAGRTDRKSRKKKSTEDLIRDGLRGLFGK